MPDQVRFLFPICAPHASVFSFSLKLIHIRGGTGNENPELGLCSPFTNPPQAGGFLLQEMHHSSVTLGFCWLRSMSFKGKATIHPKFTITFANIPKIQLMTQLHLNSEFSTCWLFSGGQLLIRHLLLSLFIPNFKKY